MEFEVAVVNDIVLNSTSKFFADAGQWDGIGAISFQKVKGIKRKANGIAFPYFSNLSNYPLRNELVYIFRLPSAEIQESTSKEVYYYLTPLNIQNHPNNNALPNIFDNKHIPESERRDYKQTSLGAAKEVSTINSELDLGEYFTESSQIKPLKKFEGDVILEGRVGNSIRFGTTSIHKGKALNNWSTNGSNGQPITIIRNGQGKQGAVGFLPTEETINNDNSSIYLTSTQRIPITPSSTNSYYSYTSTKENAQGREVTGVIPQPANQYSGDQILLNSARIFINSKSDSIFLSSADTINLNSIQSVNVDTEALIVSAGLIRLGEPDATEPLLYGNRTVQVLEDIVKILQKILQASQTATAGAYPVATLNTVGTLEATTIQLLVEQIKHLKSTTTYTA